MPIPKPKDGESESDFISRCMGNDTMNEEYPDNEQRSAICYSQWRKKKDSMPDVSDKLLTEIRKRGWDKKTPFNFGILTADRYVKTLEAGIGIDLCNRFLAKGQVSFSDVLEKASKTLVYSNPDMVCEECYSNIPEGIELPKNTLMVFRHVLTSSTIDRDKDRLRTGGAIVDPKMLMLFQHAHTMPIGKYLKTYKHTDDILIPISAIVDINAISHDSAVMVDNGMGRFSHGFKAREYERFDEDDEESGFDVKSFEILEESLVSVPANPDAEEQEILLSLVEGGKLTSTIMKKYGKSIREHRPIQVPVTLDLKITVNGEETKDEKRNETKTTNKRETSTPEKTDANTGEKKSTENNEVEGKPEKKAVTGSYEDISYQLQQKIKEYLKSKKIRVSDDDYTYIEATFADYVVVRLYSYGRTEDICYKIAWSMIDDIPTLNGEPEEVVLITTTEIAARQFKLGVTKEYTIKDAMSLIFEKANKTERKHVIDILKAMEDTDKQNEYIEQYRAIVGLR